MYSLRSYVGDGKERTLFHLICGSGVYIAAKFVLCLIQKLTVLSNKIKRAALFMKEVELTEISYELKK